MCSEQYWCILSFLLPHHGHHNCLFSYFVLLDSCSSNLFAQYFQNNYFKSFHFPAQKQLLAFFVVIGQSSNLSYVHTESTQ